MVEANSSVIWMESQDDDDTINMLTAMQAIARSLASKDLLTSPTVRRALTELSREMADVTLAIDTVRA